MESVKQTCLGNFMEVESMYYFTSQLLTYNIDATDGEMGKVKDLYMDDHAWKIRYAIVDTRKWLPERKVLLPPSAFKGINPENETIEVEYDKNTIKNSPAVPENTDLTREHENQLMNYFGWTRYWPNDVLVGNEHRALGVFHDEQDPQRREQIPNEIEEEREILLHQHGSSLRSHEEIMNARVHGKDGKLGKVVDFVHDEDWNVKFIVVTSLELTKKDFYFYPMRQITSIDWYEGDVYLDETLINFESKLAFSTKEDILVNFHS